MKMAQLATPNTKGYDMADELVDMHFIRPEKFFGVSNAKKNF